MNEYMIALYLDLLCPGFHYVGSKDIDVGKREEFKERHIEGLIKLVLNGWRIENE